ncbi:MAG: hypothetical protein EU533_04530, partial [Promethearchaeota archaeon]
MEKSNDDPLDIYSPKFMEWGIITKENFKDMYDVPIKRWDPLSTVIAEPDEFGFHKKENRFHGHYAYLSPIRGKRPKGFKMAEKKIDLKEKDWNKYIDVFKAVTEGKAIYDKHNKLIGDGYTLVITEDEEKKDKPFSDTPHRLNELDSSCKAVTLINRYPSMARVVDPEIEAFITKNLPPHLKLAKGINLITISRNFYPAMDLEAIPEEILSAIFLSMKEAVLYCILEAIERDYYDIPVNP